MLLTSVRRLEPFLDYCSYRSYNPEASIAMKVAAFAGEISRWRHAVAIEAVEGLSLLSSSMHRANEIR